MKVQNGDMSDGDEAAPSTDPSSSSPPPPTSTTSGTTNHEAAAASRLAESSPSSATSATPSLSSPRPGPTSQSMDNNPRHLTIDTDTPSLLSDVDSSVVPTSARLSLATTHQSLPASLDHDVLPPPINGDPQGGITIRQMLDTVLANPGWNVAAAATAGRASDAIVTGPTGRARGDSLFSIGRNSLQPSLVPTLPPYEMHTQHREVREVHISFDDAGAGEGPSEHRGPQRRSEGRAKERWGEGKREGHGGDDVHNQREERLDGMNGEEANDGNGEGASGDDAAPPLHAVEQEAANALSAHYSSIVRTIDERYTSELDRLKQELSAQRDRHVDELALMRNNVDAAYRQVLKARDQQVEKAKGEAATRVYELEKEVLASNADNARKLAESQDQTAKEKEAMLEEHAKSVERERNAVEDIWERRWRDRMSLLDEEASRKVRERDKAWLRFLERNHPEVLDEAKDALFPVNDEGSG